MSDVKVTSDFNGVVTVNSNPDTKIPVITQEPTYINTETGQIVGKDMADHPLVSLLTVSTVRSDPTTIPENTPIVSNAASSSGTDPKSVDYEEPLGPVSNKGVTGPTAGVNNIKNNSMSTGSSAPSAPTAPSGSSVTGPTK